ncbi:MAG: hypothetical protein ACKV2T_03190 [Kofleriaceae bacterium]
MKYNTLVIIAVAFSFSVAVACDSSTSGHLDAMDIGAPAGDGGIDSPVTRPHPLYPALDLDQLPGLGGGSIGPYQVPVLPTTTRQVTVSGTGQQAVTNLLAACQTPGTSVSVPDSVGRLGTVDLGNVLDCDIELAANVVIAMIYVGHLPGPTIAPVQRVRVRGGQIGLIMVDPGSTDIVFDGVIVNNAVVPPAQRSGTGIIFNGSSSAPPIARFAFVNSILRMVATLPDGGGNTSGAGFIGGGAHHVLFANNNIVTAGNFGSYAFRISGGHNYLIVDNTARVSMHKLVRMNDELVDYVLVKGGLWLREATLTANGMELNDSFQQLNDEGTDHIYIHDPEVYLLSTVTVGFGAWPNGVNQVGRSWEARRISWHARNANVISDAILNTYASFCVVGAVCDYGAGTHNYSYDPNLSFPPAPWRTLPAIVDSNPDNLPVTP